MNEYGEPSTLNEALRGWVLALEVVNAALSQMKHSTPPPTAPN